MYRNSFVLFLAITSLLGGCRATSIHAGSGDLTLAPSTAIVVDRYLNNPNAISIAVTTDGTSFGSVNCPNTRCLYEGGSPEAHAIKVCERGGKTCKALAVRDVIVWDGDITIRKLRDDERVVTFARDLGSVKRISRGVATLETNHSENILKAKLAGKECIGTLNSDKKRWKLNCIGADDIAGFIEPSDESLFWGKSDDGQYQIKVSRADWPALLAALEEHTAARVAEAKIVATSPRLQSETARPADFYSQATRKLDLNWHGHFDNSVGTIRFTDSTDVGNVTFAMPDGIGECLGTFTFATKTAGKWSANCPGKPPAEGMFELFRNGGYGRGADSVGNEISFVLGPIIR